MEAMVSYLLMLQKYINSKLKTMKLVFQNIDNLKKTGLGGVAIFCSVDFNPIDTKNFLDIHKYLIKKMI